MGSSDVAQSKYFTFPLSPPSSGTVTAFSSHCLPTVPTDKPDSINQRFTFPSARLNPNTHPSHTKPQDSAVALDVSSSKDSSPDLISLSSHNEQHKSSSNVAPSNSSLSIMTPVLSPAAHCRSSSLSSSSSSSSSLTPLSRETTHTPNTGMGRKVTAKLQLFRESAGPSESLLAGESSRPQSSGRWKAAPSHIGDDEGITEVQFKFVKRSEWPGREAAAIRQEKSMMVSDHAKDNIVQNGRPQDHNQYQENVSQEYNPWRRGFVENSTAKRGRRRDRTLPETDERGDNHVSPNRGEPTFPPSSSLSKSRRPSTSSQLSQQISSTSVHSRRFSTSQHLPAPREGFPAFTLAVNQNGCRSSSLSAPISPVESTSSWLTDGNSTWETASITTSTSTAPSTSTQRGDRNQSPVPSYSTSEDASLRSPRNSLAFGESDSDHFLRVDVSQECLSHIPLQPFENQVGGHTSIYKFTKQAVCKVCVTSVSFLPVHSTETFTK